MSRRWVPLAAFLVALMGVVNIGSAWLVHVPERMRLLRAYLPLEVVHGGRMAAVLSGLALLFLSANLLRSKRRAWELTCAALAVAFVSHLAKGLDWEEALVNLGLLLFLVLVRRDFRAQSDRPSALRGLRVLALAILSTCLYGAVGFYLLDGKFSRNLSLRDAFLLTLSRFFEVGGPQVHPVTHRGVWFLNSLDVVGALSLAYAFFQILRPVVYRHAVTRREQQRAAELVAQYGRSSLARFTLFDDKSYFFASSGRCYIAYRTVGSVAVALGDPIGPGDEVGAAVGEFRRFCRDNDWQPCFYQVLPDHLAAYRSHGLKTLQIGEEAVIDLRGFSLDGHERKPLRQAVSKMTRSGYRTVLFEPPLDAETIRRLREVSDEWLAGQHSGEKSFSLGWFDPAYLRETPVMAVEDGEGRLVAFANLVGEYTRNEGTLDLMRRRREGERGIMELLFVRIAEHLRDAGCEGFNLGLAPLAGVGTCPEASLPERTVHFFYEHFNRFYSFKGLHHFKAKFGPHWEPRYLVYTSHAALPKVALAIVRADSPGALPGLDVLKQIGARARRPKPVPVPVTDVPVQEAA